MTQGKQEWRDFKDKNRKYILAQKMEISFEDMIINFFN